MVALPRAAPGDSWLTAGKASEKATPVTRGTTDVTAPWASIRECHPSREEPRARAAPRVAVENCRTGLPGAPRHRAAAGKHCDGLTVRSSPFLRGLFERWVPRVQENPPGHGRATPSRGPRFAGTQPLGQEMAALHASMAALNGGRTMLFQLSIEAVN